jgi:hypothetical protein
VVLYPASFPSDTHAGRSSARLTLYLGRYVYEIARDGVAYKSSLNFLVNPYRVLKCDLRDRPGCNLVDEPLEDCR